MKKKHTGIISLTIFLASLTLAATYSYWSVQNIREQGGFRGRVPKMKKVKMPPKSDLQTMKELHLPMADLAIPGGREGATVDLGLFQDILDLKLEKEEEQQEELVEETTQSDLSYSITFAFVSDLKRYCFIDGKLYEEGESLPDGAKVMSIMPSKVLIGLDTVTKWIDVTKASTDQEKKTDNA